MSTGIDENGKAAPGSRQDHPAGSSCTPASRAAWFARVATLGCWAVASRLLGLVRDLAMAWLLGAGSACAALVAATLLPHAVRKLLADGVLSLPVTSAVAACAAHGRDGQAAPARRKADILGLRLFCVPVLADCLPVLLPACAVLLLVLLAAAGPLVSLVGAGEAGDPAWVDEAARLVRLAAAYLPLALMAALAMGFLHARGAYARASASPVLFNLTMLVFIALACAGLGEAAPLMAAGFSVAGLVQLIWLFLAARRIESPLPAPRAGLRAARALSLRLRLGVFRLPAVVTAASTLPLALLAAMIPASLAGEGGMAALYFADRLLELPIGIIGACMGIAALPELSSSAARHEDDVFAQRLGLALRTGLLFSLPAMAGLFVVAPLLCQILLGHGAFSQDGVLSTALVLRCLVPALPAGIALRTLVAACHAAGADRLAWTSALGCMLFTLAFGLGLHFLGPSSLQGMAAPLAVTASLWLQCLVLLRFLLPRGQLFVSPGDAAALGCCGAAAGLGALPGLALFGTGILALASACLLGAACWLGAVRLLLPGAYRLLAGILHGGKKRSPG